jgi:hypothetical protein
VRKVIAAAVVAWLALTASMPGAAARRIALVIGNADYKIGALANPVNDAAAVAKAFETQLGFNKVMLRTDLGVEAFRAALLELSREIADKGAEVAAVYFAGHGIEAGGKNYLLPVDARLASAGNLSLEAIALDQVLDQLSGTSRLKLVILDACRSNPFPLPGAKRSVSRGLARVEPEDNTLIAYAAKDGTVADDGAGRLHSPYTEALLRHLATPGLEINLLFRRVRDDVLKATRHLSAPQQPHIYASLGGQELYLKAPVSAPVGSVPAPLTSGPSGAEVAQFCQSVAVNPSLAVLRSLRETYRGTPMLACIDARIAELERPVKSLPSAKFSTQDIIAEKGQWISRFNIDFSSRAAPGVFTHYFIVIDGSAWLAPGAVVTGARWDPSVSPLWRVVHGHLLSDPENSWHMEGDHVAYLGPRWLPEFAELSTSVFKAQKGRKLGKIVTYR